NPEHFDSWVNKGKLFFAREEFSQALHCFEEAAQIDPNSKTPRHYRETISDLLGKPIERPNREIKISNFALKKILLHALVFTGIKNRGEDDSFNMVLGVLGGNNKANHVNVENACPLTHGDNNKVALEPEGYQKLMQFDEILFKESNFMIGWYCSIPEAKDFFNSTNYRQHLNYQRQNKLAIAIAINPTYFSTQSLQNYFKIYRLKDDLSENWVELGFDLEEDEVSLLNEIHNISLKFLEIFNPEDIEKYEHLDNYLKSLGD
ncbi:MAG: hypothetical protein ACFFBI_14330, partial [Promethearchaeota archaeon]